MTHAPDPTDPLDVGDSVTATGIKYEQRDGRAIAVDERDTGGKRLITTDARQLELDATGDIHVLVDGKMTHVEALGGTTLSITRAAQDGVDTVRITTAGDADLATPR